MGGAPTPGSPTAGTAGSPTAGTAGQVFTAPTRPSGGGGNHAFLLGVAVGAAAVLAGALVGGWFVGRKQSRSR